MRSIVLITATAITLVGCSHKIQYPGVDGMASQVPATSLAFVGLDGREKVPSDFRATLEKKKDDPRIKGSLENYQRQMGHDAITAMNAFEPAGWGIIVEANGAKNMVAGIMVRDRKLAETCLSQTFEKETPTKTDNIDTYKKAGYSTCFQEPFLIISDKPEAIKAVVQRQGASLAEDAGYKAAHSQMFQSNSLAFVYSTVPVSQKGIRYFAGGVGKESPYRPSAFLALDPAAATPLVKSLLTAPAASSDYVPANWNFNMHMQLRYPLEAVSQAVPKALDEPAKDLPKLGTSSAQVDKAFEGDLALGLDLDQYFAKGIPQGPPNGLLAIGLRNPAEFEAFWKSFCRGNGLKTSAAKVGNYQVDRFSELPFMILARQGKQALLVLANQPDDLLKTLKPGKTDASVFSIRYDLDNTRIQLAKSGLLSMSPQTAPLAAQMESSSKEFFQGDMSVKVEKDGIRFEGNPLTMLIVGVFNVAFLSEFL